MSERNWLEILGWGSTEIEDLRIVAYSYLKQGVYDVALTFFNALAVLAPPSFYDLQTLGALHLQLGNGLKALEFLDQALKLHPNDFPTQMNRAKAFFMLGYKKQGILAAIELAKNDNKEIASQASALLLAYQ